MTRSINIVYFSWVRERMGRDEETLDLAPEVETIQDVVDMLKARDASHAEIFADVDKLRFALDQDYGSLSSVVGQSRELAIFPPVTGG